MTKAGALYSFWSGFGIPAYDENSVPTGNLAPDFPYITYEVLTDSFGNNVVLSGSVWYKSNSWVEINAKTEEISKYIGRSGRAVKFDGGAIWLSRGTPFAQSMGDPDDSRIKRKYLNIEAEFICEN